MRVSSFFPAQSQSEAVGLEPIEMPRLGRVVVLAGRNGSGKTRTLQILTDTIRHLAASWNFDDAAINNNIISHEKQLTRSDLPPNIREVNRANLELWSRHRDIRRRTTLTGLPQHAAVTDFTPSSDKLSDPSQANRARQIQSHQEVTSELGMTKIKDNATVYIDFVASRSFNAGNPETRIDNTIAREQYKSAWTSLRDTVNTLLPSANLGRNVDGNVIIFGFPIGAANLSQGQRALLRVAVALHAQSLKLEDAILTLDEPETHLHPDALVEFIDRLINSTPNGQVWIATHSIHILSYVDPESLWYVENGSISWSGRRPERVLRNLVGDEERIGRLERFIHLPSVLALERFAAECLLPPAIVSTGAEDRQSKQIHHLLEASRSDGKPLRVLDYGAGRGRILATLRQSIDDLSSTIDYRAFEPNKHARTDCIGAVADAYHLNTTDAAGLVYESEESIRQRLKGSTVDVAILCNVLHEIHPSKWRRFFVDQALRYCLKPSGHLLILEDMKIPHGEHAHKDGFILLDTEQLQTLFVIDREDPDEFSTHSDSSDERLKAHLIRADTLQRITGDSIKAALNRRLDSAGDRIQELRNQPASFANGHLLALYTAIYANTALALREL